MIRTPSIFSLVAFAAVGLCLLAAPVVLAFVSHVPGWTPVAVAGAAILGLAVMPSAHPR